MCFFLIFENLFDYLLSFTEFVDTFDTLLIITLFLLALLLVCLLTLRLNINIKHSGLFFSFITDINEYFEISNPLPPLIKINKDLQPLRLFWLPRFIRH